MTAAVVVTGMGYTMEWNQVVYHLGYPAIPADFSQTLRDAIVVSEGHLGHVYSDHAQLVTLPGLPVLLAPVAALVRLVHPAWPWVVAGPFAMATAGVALVGADRLAISLGVGRGRRQALVVVEAVAVWPAVALWGHPEDVLAVGLCCLCLAAATDGRWGAAGWLLGAALSVQLVAVLILPVVLAAAGRSALLRVAARAAALPAILAATVLIPDFGSAWPALTRQPNYPLIDHATPWVLLSPSLGDGAVAAGPARVAGLLAAGCCGLAARRSADPLRLVWLAALTLAARCLFEAVMDPYYVMPAVVVALVLAAREGGRRASVIGLTSLAVTVDTAVSFGMWTYWVLLAALITTMMAAAAPGPPPQVRPLPPLAPEPART